MIPLLRTYCMEFSKYYVLRSLEDALDGSLLSESVSDGFDVAKFVRDSRKKAAIKDHVLYFSRRHPHVRACDVEDAVLDAISSLSKEKPKDEAAARKKLRKRVDASLSETSKRVKDTRRKLSCLKSVKSFSSKGMDLEAVIGKAKGILSSNERMALDLCSSGHSVREMGSIMKISFPTAWRTLNRALDKVRISNGMKSRNRDRR